MDNVPFIKQEAKKEEEETEQETTVITKKETGNKAENEIEQKNINDDCGEQKYITQNIMKEENIPIHKTITNNNKIITSIKTKAPFKKTTKNIKRSKKIVSGNINKKISDVEMKLIDEISQIENEKSGTNLGTHGNTEISNVTEFDNKNNCIKHKAIKGHIQMCGKFQPIRRSLQEKVCGISFLHVELLK
ncbi:unnamed protein product [Leptidea sinapis]|uniref:Uncharacterized protein n=1 Tax=Leptidea sinapis TaxID=189913 RepID=A0A5E4QMZ5_9NEOP|nr:unnamed protein product [Leptidea sinapis]